MSEFEDLEAQVTAWLEPLSGDAGTCGADLEYDNEFLDLTKAAAGKPESQFGPAEPPDWRAVVNISASLFDRTRDLRVAIEWLRGNLHLRGYGALPAGLKLVNGLIEWYWPTLHPLPDPDDGDPYGRVNALTVLREQSGALADLREAVVCADRAVGMLRVRDIEAVLAPAGAAVLPTEFTKEQAARMVAALVEKSPELRQTCSEAVAEVKTLIAAVGVKLESSDAPDLRPLLALVNAVASLLPAEETESAEDGDDDGGEDGTEETAGGGGRGRGLSGKVTSREEALKAIDLVIEYLERAEPTNPAPLFLRRARQLVGHNFLQLLKVLAPDALPEMARIVGVDPDTVQDPNEPPGESSY
ncbi:MAG: type VI secretion system ImpA family N-terminal domain-containing protein [Rubrivivax sp.]|nr:type VI secretion system ImpA family N-terminal domain-containing protein [Rubrivivax sp.]